MAISVEIKDAKQALEGLSEVEIYCDQSGLEELIRQLGFIKNGETHVHLMTGAWAGHELTEQKHRTENTLVHHLKISLVT